MAPGRTLATMFLTVSDVTDADNDVSADDRPSVNSSEALMMTPDDAADDRGTIVADTSLVDDVIVIAEDEMSSWSELVQRERDGGHSDREPARQ